MTHIEIFKVGKQTCSAGKTTEFTADTLRAAAASYNAMVAEGGDTFKAPLVIGHPRDDAPAYGWVEKLAFNEETETLLAEPGSVDEGLKTLVKEGKYKRVSASFYTPDAPSNPAKEGFFLRHLGFLGAMAPAVKGLKAVSFSDADEGVVSFGEDDKSAGVLQRLVNFVAKQFGQGQADAILFGEEVADAPAAEPETAAPAEAVTIKAPPTDFAEPATPVGQDAAVETAAQAPVTPAIDFAEVEAKLAARETELAEREEAVRAAEIENFCEGLIADGRVVPGLKNTVTTLLKTLGQAGSIDFAEGEQKPAADLLKELLSSLPKAVHYGEVATDVTGPAPEQIDFAVAPGYTVSTEDMERLRKAKAYQAAHPELTLIQAYSKI
jgi:hypothetical protein